MNLFPQHAVFGTVAPEEYKSRLTIFYGGKMLVFFFLADKDKDLMVGNLSSVDPPTSVDQPLSLLWQLYH